MKQVFKDIRSMRKILNNKDFYFVILVYPIGACIFFYLLSIIKPVDFMESETRNLYSLWTMLACTFYVFFSIYEFIDKKLLYKNQGDKLKLKAGEKEWKAPDKDNK